MNIQWRVPPVFLPLLRPSRFKGAWGGRGSGKSHFFAGQTVVDLLQGKNVLCVREVQNSIADSVKRLIEGKIAEFGVEGLFRITEREITCVPTGAVTIFRGMQNHTAASVKSLEGFDVAWWEEAQTASARSLDLLIPTIRTEGSELRFSWNPEDEKDPVDRLLRQEPPDGAIVVQANWSDNPYFPAELRSDMERDKVRDPDKAAWIWEGAYRTASEARIFRNYRTADLGEPEGVVWFYGVDWGFSVDPLAGVRCCFVDDQTLYVSHDVNEVGCSMEMQPKRLLEGLPDLARWPASADSARPDIIDFARRHGIPRLKPAIKGPGSVEDGITFLQGFDIVLHPRCAATLNEFNRYSYKRDKQTEEILPVVEDAWNHNIDALRYAVERAHRKGKLIPGIVKPKRQPRDYGLRDEDEGEDSWKVA